MQHVTDHTARANGSNGYRTTALRRQAHARILVIDDEADACEALGQVLAGKGYEAVTETSAGRALERIVRENFDLVLTDVSMAEMDGIELCRRIVAVRAELPVVLVSGRGNMDTVIAALRAGASDFLTKPVDAATVTSRVARVLTSGARPDTVPEWPSPALATPQGIGAWGDSVATVRLRGLIADLGDSAASVLIHGETGTGKELIARAIHAGSRFSAGPFVALNCAAIPAELLESELFGHVRGAFTGAVAARDGLLVLANGGTLLLDEIGELALAMQAKLLRALQERMIRPLGSSKEVRFDCRIIAATNRDLEAEVAGKRFRADLFYRLDVVRISVPPLRERGDDILLLANQFLRRFTPSSREIVGLSDAVARRLLAYPWRGNVRELENCIEHATALSRSNEIVIDDLPESIRCFDPRGEAPPATQSAAGADEDLTSNVVSLSEVERHHVLRAVRLLGGNRTRAAELLGIDRRTLFRRLQRYGVLRPGEAPDAE